MSMTETRPSRSYQFGPLEKRGLLAGMRAGQLAMFGASFLVALMFLQTAGSLGPPLALTSVIAGGGLAFFAPMGRGVDEWFPVLVRWFANKVLGQNQWFSSLPLLGNTDREEVNELEEEFAPAEGRKRGKVDPKAAKRAKQRRKMDQHKRRAKSMPPPLNNLTILEVPVGDGGGSFGVIKDAKNGLYTGVVAVRGEAFSLLEQSEKERRLQGWADVLGGMAKPSSFVHRVQWIERAVPDDGDALNRYLKEARVQSDSAPTVRSYVDLLEEFAPVAQQHETYVVVQISSTKSSRIVKKAGGGDKGACVVLMREIRQLADSLAGADINLNGVLSPRLVALVFRNAIDPEGRRSLVRRGRMDPERAGVSPNNAWALATDAKWDHYRTENVFHATYWVSEWPRLEVGPDFMAPLMVRTQRIRTVSLVMQPVDAVKAQKEIESAHTAYLSDHELRSRAGYVPTERRRRELDGVLRREQELADGFAEYRFAGYVTVTATSLEQLDEACSEVEQAAQQCHIELRRLYGEQDVAFTCTLPLCRGLN